jgi:MFS family permease
MLGVGFSGCIITGYFWLTEHFSAQTVGKASILMFLGGSLTPIVCSIVIYFTKDWRVLYGTPIVIHIFALIYMVLFLQDGPKYDYSKGNYDKTRLKLTKIGRINGILAPNQSFTKVFRKEMEENLT